MKILRLDMNTLTSRDEDLPHDRKVVGGLGGAAAEVLSENYPVEVRRLGIPDQFGEVVVEDKYIFDKYGFGPDHIMAACKKISGSK